MANQNLFRSSPGPLLPAATGLNSEQAPAYELAPRHALAQYAVTGCLNATFYADAEGQLQHLLELAGQVESEFIAQTAIYCRQQGYMKDMPVLLCAVLAGRRSELLARVFPRVVDDARQLRTFVQILRSGVVGRKSLGSAPKRLVRSWLESRTDAELFCAAVGQSPSLADVIRLAHPKPDSASRAALYGYLTDRRHDSAALPELVKQNEAFKAQPRGELPAVPFLMLNALPLGQREWAGLAARSSWQTTRMQLNTFGRHGVFGAPKMCRLVADRLRDPAAIRKARAFPYQLLAAYSQAARQVPAEVREALQDAMELAIENVPRLPGQAYVCVDVSGSMHSPVTGVREGATTAVTCVQVAALVAAAVVRRNPTAAVVPFSDHVAEDFILNPRDSVMTNAQRLASLPSGGTNCSAALAWLNRRQARGDLVLYVSDNESWVDAAASAGGRATGTLQEWARFQHRNPQARLACLDLQPNATTQAAEREDILNLGGFSDHVFGLLADFAAGRMRPGHWVETIAAIAL